MVLLMKMTKDQQENMVLSSHKTLLERRWETLGEERWNEASP